MYSTYKQKIDKYLKSILKSGLIITGIVVAVFLFSLVRNGVEFATNWRFLFLWALPAIYWAFAIKEMSFWHNCLKELKSGKAIKKNITVKKIMRNDFTVYSDSSLSHTFRYGRLKYKLKDTDNVTYYIEKIGGGFEALHDVKNYKSMQGKDMQITYLEKSRLVLDINFKADKHTNFLKQEMTEYLK